MSLHYRSTATALLSWGVITFLIVSTSVALAQSPNYPPQPPPGYFGGQQPPAGQFDQLLDQLMQWERQDLGVAPLRQLHIGAMHGSTPNQIPGGQLITTKGLLPLMQGTQGASALVFDVLGDQQQLPNAIGAVYASQPGSFGDLIQRQFGQMLQQRTGGNLDMPLVFYCRGLHCWMSYNAALRAINLGYRNVLWYRGGLEAWQAAGLPLANTQAYGRRMYPGGQPGSYPGGQPGSYPGGQPGSYPGGQPGSYPGG